jgi:hypothetical protein
MEAVNEYETSVNLYQTKQRNTQKTANFILVAVRT